SLMETMIVHILVLLLAIINHAEGRSSTNTMLNPCDRKWELIYSHDELGASKYGSKRELLDLAMSANYVKVSLYMPDHILILPADNIYKRDNEICMQSLKALATNGTHVDNDDPWLFYLACSTGHVTELNIANSSTVRVAMDWYIKDISFSSEPIYSSFYDGCPMQESHLVRLHEAAKKMSLFLAMRDKPYVFPLHNVFHDTATGEVGGQNLLHLGQRYEKDYITFNDIPYKWFSYWSNTGHRDNARWALQKHKAYKHNADTAAVDWYADICWRHIYTNDMFGLSVFGSLDDLLDAIKRGHRVRVRFDNVALEVSNMRVKNRTVAAQLFNEVTMVSEPNGNRFIQNDTRVRLSVVHTTGRVHTYDYLVGSTERKYSNDKKTIEWMIDTRPWSVVLKTVEPPGDAVVGSEFDLQAAIMGGASIRLNIELDPLAGSFYTQANNIRVDLLTETIYAQALDHLSDVKSKVPYEYELQKSIYYWYLLLSSKGSLRMTAWMYGTDDFRYEEIADEATITWFANF
ncbi:hypothetical protein BgiMline_009435, partial [Biomphalaria glabrata]